MRGFDYFVYHRHGTIIPSLCELQPALPGAARTVRANPTTAQAFIDFLVSEEGQKIFAEGNYEYPLLQGVALHPDITPLDTITFANIEFGQIV